MVSINQRNYVNTIKVNTIKPMIELMSETFFIFIKDSIDNEKQRKRPLLLVSG